MTAEHLKPMLESEVDFQNLYEVAAGHVPEEVVDALRIGRMTALQKDDGESPGHRCGRRVSECGRAHTLPSSFACKERQRRVHSSSPLSTRAGW